MDASQVADKAITELMQRIDGLAMKLGTTANHVFDIYVAQARVEATRDAMVSIFFFIVGMVAAIRAHSIYKKRVEDDELPVLFECFIFVAIISFVFTLLNAYASFGEALNPQYWALHQLGTDIKSLF